MFTGYNSNNNHRRHKTLQQAKEEMYRHGITSFCIINAIDNTVDRWSRTSVRNVVIDTYESPRRLSAAEDRLLGSSEDPSLHMIDGQNLSSTEDSSLHVVDGQNLSPTEDSSLHVVDGQNLSSTEELGHVNPKDYCPLCSRLVEDDARHPCCENCDYWLHLQCIGITEEQLPEGDYFCPSCTNNQTAVNLATDSGTSSDTEKPLV